HWVAAIRFTPARTKAHGVNVGGVACAASLVTYHPPPMRSGRRLPAIPSLSDLPGIAKLARLVRHIELRAVSRWVGLGLAVGLLSGSAACLLEIAFEFVTHLVVHVGAAAVLPEAAGEASLFSTTVHAP